MSRPMPRLTTIFDHEAGVPRTGYPIACCKCHGRALLDTRHFRTPPPLEYFIKHFSRLGWETSKSPARDMCPGCVKLDKAERAARHRMRILPKLPTFNPPTENGATPNNGLFALARKYAKDDPTKPKRPDQMRARIAELKRIVAESKREIVELETALHGRPVLHLDHRIAAGER